MFTYAAGRALAAFHSVPLKLDVSWYRTGNRTFLLENFNISAQICPDDMSGASDGIGYNQAQWSYYPGFAEYDNKKFLSGWWQSEKFFNSASALIRKDFSFRDASVCKWALAARKAYLGETYDSLIAVHCRRGDYVKLNQQNQFNLLPISYYRHAMRQFSGCPLFVVFSDDVEWCRATFAQESVEFCHEPDPIKALAMMAVCDHYIIANSTFSWWAAWLGEKDETVVFAPSHDQWFGPVLNERYETKDILPERWVQLRMPPEMT